MQQGVKKASLLGASVGLLMRRTLSMSDMAHSDPDAQAPWYGGWSR
ncbi:hypothetical protein OM945_13695 [Levilactobacillus namurensis]|nr:hypothetical protein [Levilactobacillus namurensis]